MVSILFSFSPRTLGKWSNLTKWSTISTNRYMGKSTLKKWQVAFVPWWFFGFLQFFYGCFKWLWQTLICDPNIQASGWFQTFFDFHPYLGKWSNLTSIFFDWVEIFFTSKILYVTWVIFSHMLNFEKDILKILKYPMRDSQCVIVFFAGKRSHILSSKHLLSRVGRLSSGPVKNCLVGYVWTPAG